MSNAPQQLKPAAAASLALWHDMIARCDMTGLAAIAHPDVVFRSPAVFAPYQSAPVLVQRLRDASQYTGATGTYSATVDVEHTNGIVPSFIAGSRSVYNGVGTVDAAVDLGALTKQVQRDAQGTLVIRLPHATFGDVHLDAGRSHVMSRDRGLVDRLEGVFVDSPTSEREVQQLSQRRIAIFFLVISRK